MPRTTATIREINAQMDDNDIDELIFFQPIVGGKKIAKFLKMSTACFYGKYRWEMGKYGLIFKLDNNKKKGRLCTTPYLINLFYMCKSKEQHYQ
jgi:hypothetical protein